MHVHRVEVVVRFAGDLVDVFEVMPGTAFHVGTTPIRAASGTEAAVGHVTVTMSPAPRKRVPVPRPRIEARPYVYGAASLLAQLAIVAIAWWTASTEQLSAPAIEASGTRLPGATRIKRFAAPAQTIERTPDPAPVETPITADQTPEQVERDEPAPVEMTEFVPSEMTGGGLVTDGREDADGTSRFDPAENPAFDTIKVGDYSTLATGRAAGEGYGPQARNSSLVVITCDRASCLVLGGAKAARVRKAVDERLVELTDCYKQAAESGGGKVEIDFAVDERGSVKDVEIEEADPAGSCVARIIRTLRIDGADADAAATADG
jgi:hypothetical protein